MEYALLLAAIAVVIMAVVFGFGQYVNGVFEDTADCIAAQDQPAGPFPNC